MRARLRHLIDRVGVRRAVLAASLAGVGADVDQAVWCEAAGEERPPSAEEMAAASVAGVPATAVISALHEMGRGADRRARGAVYTPPALSAGLVDLALDGAAAPRTVCDPAVGAGTFVVAAADAFHRAGVRAAEVVGERLHGFDLDPSAVVATRLALARWSLEVSGTARWLPPGHVRVIDFLDLAAGRGAPSFDLVVGNPPFGGQLRGEGVRDPGRYAALATAHGLDGFGYADTSALFLLAACSVVSPGGRVSLVLPQPLLAARAAAPLRARVEAAMAFRAVWWAPELMFDAGVRVWAPVLEHRHATGAGPARSVLRRCGPDLAVAPATSWPPDGRPGARSWSGLVAGLDGTPTLGSGDLSTQGVLGDLATATAGFRRHFYGLAEGVGEEGDDPSGAEQPLRLVTVGSVDPARCGWGEWDIRFAGRTWTRPAVDPVRLAAADAAVAAWVHDRLRPKVLVATQTAVVEAVADAEGRTVPSTPLLSVEPARPADVMKVAAVLLAPPVSAWIARRHAGSGLSSGTVRVSARDLVQVPLPSEDGPWEEGALHAAAAHAAAASGDATAWSTALDHLGDAMTCAYGMAPDHPVVAWWRSRRPGWRTAPAGTRMGSARGKARDDGRL